VRLPAISARDAPLSGTAPVSASFPAEKSIDHFWGLVAAG
jgi:hypothetical protein